MKRVRDNRHGAGDPVGGTGLAFGTPRLPAARHGNRNFKVPFPTSV